MTITAHAGWTLDPVANPDPTITHSLPLAAQSYSVFGSAVDSADPSASFTFSWSILLPRTGQTASLSSATAQNPTLQNVSDTWGDVRLFLVATNTATAETSDSDPRTAPASAFCTLQIESAARSLRLPAIGSRDWYTALDTITSTLDTLTINNGIDTATVNGSGELILTLDDGSTVNAGSVVGPAGADGADGADGAAGPSERLLVYSGHVTQWYDLDSTTLQSGFNPSKLEPIFGPFRPPTAVNLQHISLAVRNAGSNTNSVSFNVFKCSAANWALDTLTSDSQTFTITASGNDNPMSVKYTFSPAISVSAGELFGIEMNAPSLGAMNGISISITAEEA
jgi:hypothetical protein